MFDEPFYLQSIMPAAEAFLRQNMRPEMRQFAESFMSEHDIRYPSGNPRLASALFNHVADASRRLGLNGSFTDDQLYQLVGEYINNIARIHFNNERGRQTQGGGFGTSGFSTRSSGFGASSGGGFGNTGGFGSTQTNRMSMGSGLHDDSIKPKQQAQPAPMMTMSDVPKTQTAPIKEMTVIDYGYNPLDDLPDSATLSHVTGQCNWGTKTPVDNSIIMMKRDLLKTPDERYAISLCDGFERTFMNDPMDVARDFFRVVPDQFLAEHFVFRIFYNHIERVDVPTDVFLDVQNQFLQSMERDRQSTVYQTVVAVLNQMQHRPRMAMAAYLVGHINRALHTAFGMAEFPELRISFDVIEDLDELLGTGFSHKILEIPNARSMIIDIINNALRNALAGYSSVMFTSSTDTKMTEIIRSSSVFPFSIPGVYPNKTILPSSNGEGFQDFYTAFREKELDKVTYVRSIRSVIITNILGRKELPRIGDKPTRVKGIVPGVLSQYVINYISTRGMSIDECKNFDEDIRVGEQDATGYEAYLTNPHLYTNLEVSTYTDQDPPRYPVDQTVFAIQYKKSPAAFLVALDLCTTLNASRSDDGAILSKRKLAVLHPTM